MTDLSIALLELRGTYEKQLVEFESQQAVIREKLNHLNALLVDQLVPDSQPIELSAIPELNLPAIAPSLEEAPNGTVAPVTEVAAAEQPDVAPTEEPKTPKSGARKTKAAATKRKTTAAKQQTKAPKSTTKTAVAKTAKRSKTKTGVRGRAQILSLAPAFDGLSKIDAVAKVLGGSAGKVLHIEDIIERLYGTLSAPELKAEKMRMKDVMVRGVKRNLWQKAEGVPLSYIATAKAGKETAAQESKPTTKTRARKPRATKKPISGRRRRTRASKAAT